VGWAAVASSGVQVIGTVSSLFGGGTSKEQDEVNQNQQHATKAAAGSGADLFWLQVRGGVDGLGLGGNLVDVPTFGRIGAWAEEGPRTDAASRYHAITSTPTASGPYGTGVYQPSPTPTAGPIKAPAPGLTVNLTTVATAAAVVGVAALGLFLWTKRK
jgi:hypothetical protein